MGWGAFLSSAGAAPLAPPLGGAFLGSTLPLAPPPPPAATGVSLAASSAFLFLSASSLSSRYYTIKAKSFLLRTSVLFSNLNSGTMSNSVG